MKIYKLVSIVIILAVAFVLILVGPNATLAATAPSLGSLSTFGIVSGTFTNANTPPQTIINGNTCYTTGPDTVPTTYNGTAGACPGAAGADQLAALNNVVDGLNVQACTDLGASAALNNVAGHLTGVYTPGCYSTSGAGATSMTITTGTTVTLSGAGVYIFKAAGALKPAANTTIVLTNGATADKVFWAPVEATTIGANSTFIGNIIDAAGITIGQFSTLLGRALAFGGTVTLDANTITVPTYLKVIKTVTNDNGGTSNASAFSTTIAGVTTAVPTATGVADPGVDNVLTSVGAYSVDEGAHAGYDKTLSVGCSGTIALGETKTCTITNNDIAPHLIVIKTVVNDNGGASVASDFTTTISDVTTATPIAAGVEDPGVNNVLTSVGAYSVDEGAHAGYDKTLSVGCSGTIALGETKTCTITNNDIAPVTTAAASASSSGYSIIPRVPPLINVVKIPSPLALPAGSGPVMYTYTLSNIGIVPVTDIALIDDSCKPVTIFYGDANGDSKLDVNETWIFHCTTTLSKTHTNTVVATGWNAGFSATDVSSATVVVGVSVVPPLIHVVKKPDTFILPAGGGAVTYTYTVTNPGTEPLSDVSITDNKCTGLPGRVLGHPGDLNKNNLLESNEIWTFTCKTDLTQTTTNIGTAIGYANGLSAIDLSPATVVVAPIAATITDVPILPNTGVAPDGKSIPWNIVIPAGIFAVSIFLYFFRRKQTV
ncbi:MAG: ice-binding family protein [bacterium]|nr:ice-binding family protein [bacterium]